MTAAFRDLVGDMDAAIFADLADDATIDGRPVCGMFASPWREPQLGHLKTGLVEPQLSIRDADAVGVENGALVECDGFEYEVMSIEPDGTGITMLVLRPMA